MVGWVNKMKKNNFLHTFFLLIIFISMLGIIFIGRQLGVANKDYQPTAQRIKTKAADKTYYKLITFNQVSPTLPRQADNQEVNLPTPTLLAQLQEESQLSPATDSSFLEKDQLSPTPTETILVKNSLPTATETIIPSITLNKLLPESGNYQNFLFFFIFSLFIIFLAFVL